MNEMQSSYILVTPAKNEQENLPKLIDSIANQCVRPAVWIIVDDGSNDNTYELINNASFKFPWILCIKLESKKAYDIEENYSNICRIGFEFAQEYCKKDNIYYDYIALSDADTIYPTNYFHKLLIFLKNNKDYGIISGTVLIKKYDGSVYFESREIEGLGQPLGTGRIWRKQAFGDTDGYIITKSPDSVSNVMALLKGWKIKRLIEVECYQSRETGSKIDLWEGYYSRGRRAYYVGANILYVFNSVISLLFLSRSERRVVKCVGFFCGYLNSFIKCEPRISNVAVRRYIGSYRLSLLHYVFFMRWLLGNHNDKN